MGELVIGGCPGHSDCEVIENCLPYFIKDPFMITVSKTAFNCPSPTSASLLANSKTSGAPSLAGSLTICVEKLSSTQSGSLLDCIRSAVLYFQ